jgi:hypothetical protein
METTSVCNVKVKNIRPDYDNLKEWMCNSNNVYIGRKGIVFIDGERFPKSDSVWANPFKINEECSRDDVLKKYKKYMIKKINNDDNLRKKLMKLKGKNLGCWCHPEACHGDILIELIDKYEL